MTPQGYSRTQVWAHWATAGLVAGQLLFAGGIAAAFARGIETGEPRLNAAAAAHMATGGAIFLLSVWRLLIRQDRGAPVPPPGTPPWQARAARAGHAALYFLLLSMPMTGAVAWGMASPTAASAHQAGKAALIGLVALHVAAALFGQVMRRDGTLARMLRPGR